MPNYITSYRSTIDIIALNCLVFQKIAFWRQSDRLTDKQTNRWMDSTDAWSRSRWRERRLNNSQSFSTKKHITVLENNDARKELLAEFSNKASSLLSARRPRAIVIIYGSGLIKVIDSIATDTTARKPGSDRKWLSGACRWFEDLLVFNIDVFKTTQTKFFSY